MSRDIAPPVVARATPAAHRQDAGAVFRPRRAQRHAGAGPAAPAPVEVLPALRLLLPFDEFSEAEIEEIAPLCDVVAGEQGQVLLREGDASDGRLWFILEGAVSVTIGGRFILGLRRLGDLFGEMSIINDEPHSATVSADQPSRFLVLSSLETHAQGRGEQLRLRYYFSRLFSAILADKLRLTSQRAKLYEDAILQVRDRERQTLDLAGQVARNLQQIRVFSHLVESAHDAIILTDPEGKITLANASLERSFGIAPDKVSGLQISTLLGVPASGPGSWQEIAHVAAQQGWQHEMEVLGNREAGPIPAECTVSPVRDANRERLAYAVILRDIRARRAYEERILAQSEELTRANRELREIDRLKTGFLSLVSHELRTPISSILAYAETLNTEGMVAPEERDGFIATIHKEATRLSELVTKVLAISKLESGQMPFEFQQESLAAQIELVMAMVRERAEQRHLTLAMELPERPLPTRFDPERIRDVLHYLLDNAVRYTERGAIRVTMRQDERESVIAVSDSGPGIAAELLPRVFDKFARADHMADAQQGLGLGLPLCYQIVKAHAGTIGIDCPPGRGTSVTIRLPHAPAGSG
ncbi:MAG: PAS domain S-box protein [Candidatus Lambdaproteobacteria bacterium]|nr:PAS domain S-box protein [Candidatus Lambdaproteobacteria bacterium]